MRALWRVEETMGGRRRVSSGFRGYASAKIRIETQRERTREREKERERERVREQERERERDWERMKGACRAVWQAALKLKHLHTNIMYT